jgi:hypothetical protein
MAVRKDAEQSLLRAFEFQGQIFAAIGAMGWVVPFLPGRRDCRGDDDRLFREFQMDWYCLLLPTKSILLSRR